MIGCKRVQDPKFRNRVVFETRALLASKPPGTSSFGIECIARLYKGLPTAP